MNWPRKRQKGVTGKSQAQTDPAAYRSRLRRGAFVRVLLFVPHGATALEIRGHQKLTGHDRDFIEGHRNRDGTSVFGLSTGKLIGRIRITRSCGHCDRHRDIGLGHTSGLLQECLHGSGNTGIGRSIDNGQPCAVTGGVGDELRNHHRPSKFDDAHDDGHENGKDNGHFDGGRAPARVVWPAES